jgi:hypothetical protein
VVPLVLGDLAPLALVDFAVGVCVGPDVAERAVALGVVLVPESAVAEKLVVRADDVAAARAVAVGVGGGRGLRTASFPAPDPK